MAKDKGGRDNITALVVQCKPAPEPPTERREPRVTKGKKGSSRPPKSHPGASAAPPRPSRSSKPAVPGSRGRKGPTPFFPNDASQPEIEVTGQLATGSEAEIIMIRAPRGSISDLSEPRISVVPVNSVDAETVRALDEVANAIGPSEGVCRNCGAALAGLVLVCPQCGHGQAEPLSRP
jgi:hypothetical protein